MDLESAHKKLMGTTAELQGKLRELAEFADELAGGTHRVAPRVELDRYNELCSDLEYAIENHSQARGNYLRAIRGDE